MLFQTRGRPVLSQNFAQTLFKSILFEPEHEMTGDSGNSSTSVDISGTDYIDSFYFGDIGNASDGGEESRKIDNPICDASGTDYIDALYFGAVLNSRFALKANIS